MSPPAAPQPAPPPPAWSLKLGAAVAVIAVLYLGTVWILASADVLEPCKGTGLLVFFFALIVGLASSLFSGYAVVSGALGSLVRNHPLIANLGGGFAGFFLVFYFGNAILSDGCSPLDRNVYLRFDKIETKRSIQEKNSDGETNTYDLNFAMTPLVGEDVFYNIASDGQRYSRLGVVLTPQLENDRRHVALTLSFDAVSFEKPDTFGKRTGYVVNDTHYKRNYTCEMSINIVDDRTNDYEDIKSVIEARFDPQYFKRVDDLSARSGNVVTVSPSLLKTTCFTTDGKPTFGLHLTEDRSAYGRDVLGLDAVDAPTPAKQVPDTNLQFPGEENQAAIGHDNFAPSRRRAGYAALGGEFALTVAHAAEAVDGRKLATEIAASSGMEVSDEIAQEVSGSPDVQASLLEIALNKSEDSEVRAASVKILNYGVESANPQGWKLDTRYAMLTKPIPFLDGHEKEFVDLVTDLADDLRFEVRNFIRKYPIDGFDRIFAQQISSDNQLLAYAATYFYYNRVLAIGVKNTPLTDDDLLQIEEESAKGKQWSDKLQGNLAVDKAIIDYGMSYVFFNAAGSDPSKLQQSERYATEFLRTVQNADGHYLFPSHVAQALAFQTGDLAKAKSIAKTSAALSNEPVYLDYVAGAADYSVKNPVLRRAPSTKADNVGMVEKNERVELLGRVQGWDLVKTPEAIGWLQR